MLTHLDIISFVVVAALSEKPMRDYLMNIQFVQHGICVLEGVDVSMEGKFVFEKNRSNLA